jgi:flagellar assembly protein FliH
VQLIGDCEAPPSLRALPSLHPRQPTGEEFEQVHSEIKALRARAEADIQARWEQVRAEALEQARAEVQSEFEALADASFQRWNQVIGAARADQQRIAVAAERDLVDLALAIAANVIGEFSDREAVERRVRQGLDTLSSSEITTVLLHPSDLPLVTPWIERWQATERVQVEIVPDRAVEPGGCQIVTRSGIFDFGPEARIEMIGESLRAQTDGRLA